MHGVCSSMDGGGRTQDGVTMLLCEECYNAMIGFGCANAGIIWIKLICLRETV